MIDLIIASLAKALYNDAKHKTPGLYPYVWEVIGNDRHQWETRARLILQDTIRELANLI